MLRISPYLLSLHLELLSLEIAAAEEFEPLRWPKDDPKGRGGQFKEKKEGGSSSPKSTKTFLKEQFDEIDRSRGYQEALNDHLSRAREIEATMEKEIARGKLLDAGFSQIRDRKALERDLSKIRAVEEKYEKAIEYEASLIGTRRSGTLLLSMLPDIDLAEQIAKETTGKGLSEEIRKKTATDYAKRDEKVYASFQKEIDAILSKESKLKEDIDRIASDIGKKPTGIAKVSDAAFAGIEYAAKAIERLIGNPKATLRKVIQKIDEERLRIQDGISKKFAEATKKENAVRTAEKGAMQAKVGAVFALEFASAVFTQVAAHKAFHWPVFFPLPGALRRPTGSRFTLTYKTAIRAYEAAIAREEERVAKEAEAKGLSPEERSALLQERVEALSEELDKVWYPLKKHRPPVSESAQKE
jgi:hypothetical protein